MTNNETAESGKYRDSLGIVNREGKRKWIFPKKPAGRFYNYRTILSWFLFLFLAGMPFVKYQGGPVFLFNVVERKFILFGAVFGPHDFFILLLAMLSSVVFIVLFTVVYGRVFCGWICPQTVFMEMLFRKIEYWIEGDASKQKALKAAPWNGKKIFKKTFKQALFFAVSFAVANIFLAWIIGVDQLITIITDPPSMHMSGLIAITLFSLAFYGVFSWFREQACILVCPYGRLQGVLLDRNSIVIAYDYKRGEPREKIRKKENQEDKGDCIDCRQCVDVCPTGIDIRNGTQLECINCTACIDACDYVMEKVKRPKGLIRFSSAKGIEEGTGFKFSPRIVGYSIVLILLVSLLVFLTLNRTQYDVSILRTPGLISQQMADGRLSNLYDIKVTNKTFSDVPVEFRLKNLQGEIKTAGEDLLARKQAILETKILVILPQSSINSLVTPVEIEVLADKKPIDVIKTSFMGKVE